ncbi:hypothetical protein yaldo0001_26200 [Yersinia aldovae ATCC 35236]|uniref:Uncharacterized protein n=1 Tax=Yersinia aldovae TaxID=29483 RepID=A0A0T9TZX9_YERAL|nr:hypothetical protein yaldo0001_26200 [Yersinia aldovae ATCC 35236]CNJ95464.1 Uncharacterised protein [Yersinia aldovae]CNL10950.1 Uncharacterised protein [Yersinia aldovae]
MWGKKHLLGSFLCYLQLKKQAIKYQRNRQANVEKYNLNRGGYR